MTVHLVPADPALVARTHAVVASLAAELAALGGHVLPLGSSAFEGCPGRGDLDVRVEVPAAAREALVDLLDHRGRRAQPESWTSTFASFSVAVLGHEVGVQVVTAGSEDAAALDAQQAALGDPAVRAAYARAKAHGAPLGPEGYWRVKDAFWSCRALAGPTWAEVAEPVLKVLTAPEWAALRASGSFEGSPADLRDGFVHLSAPAQVEGTVARHFAGRTDLWLLTLDAATLRPALRWEPSRGGALFPHLYRALALAEVALARPWA